MVEIIGALFIVLGGTYIINKSIEAHAVSESAKRRDEQSYEHLKILHDIYEEELEKKMASKVEESEKDEEKTES